jgi:anti-sigma factor RsiW
MKHLSIWQLTDFARGVGDVAGRSTVESHVSACSRCQGTVRVLQAVAAMSLRERTYEPPASALRHAQALYSLYRPEASGFARWVARLIHDSAVAPLPAGMRAQSRASRHAIYEAGTYCLDLQVEQQPSGLVTLVGQLADRNESAPSPADVPVWLMQRKTLMASTLCNRFGEFHLEYAPTHNLRLHVPLSAARARVEVSLDRLNPDPSTRVRPAKRAVRHTKRSPRIGR